ncbi:MAG: T9SS type A sorting domain-containing protein [Ignavibacteria bacterium]
MKSLFYYISLIVFILMIQNNVYSQMNFPLQVGNKFVYFCEQSSTYPGGGNTSYYKSSVRVLKDSIFNNHKYFFMNAYPNQGYNIWVRFDTLSKSILKYDSANTCPYYYKEKLIDSLGMLSGTANSCSGDNFNWMRIDTIYNKIGMTKAFWRFLVPTQYLINYNSNFGIISYESHMSMGAYSSNLNANMTGCFINGIKYGDTATTYINTISTNIPKEFKLSQNYPNPFNPMTKVKFSIVKAGDVKIVVYDVMGREVQTLLNERLNAGTYEVKFDGSGLTSGVYFYRLTTAGFAETKRMLLIK